MVNKFFNQHMGGEEMKKLFQCIRCKSTHDTEEKALACHPKEVEMREVFLCPHCEEPHYYEEDADECCRDTPQEDTGYVCTACRSAYMLEEDAKKCPCKVNTFYKCERCFLIFEHSSHNCQGDLNET